MIDMQATLLFLPARVQVNSHLSTKSCWHIASIVFFLLRKIFCRINQYRRHLYFLDRTYLRHQFQSADIRQHIIKNNTIIIIFLDQFQVPLVLYSTISISIRSPLSSIFAICEESVHCLQPPATFFCFRSLILNNIIKQDHSMLLFSMVSTGNFLHHVSLPATCFLHPK